MRRTSASTCPSPPRRFRPRGVLFSHKHAHRLDMLQLDGWGYTERDDRLKSEKHQVKSAARPSVLSKTSVAE